MEAKPAQQGTFTVYLEGQDVRQGNVVAHIFLTKAAKLISVLGALERAYLDVSQRQTDFEIIDAAKVNPTTLTLKAVPKTKNYVPTAAFGWGIHQLRLIADGQQPDDRVKGEIAREIVDLATKQTRDGYKNFWVNGYSEAVRFDDEFLANAQKFAHRRALEEAPGGWRVGISHGSLIGELKKVDDLDGGQQFVIVPKIGPKQVTCTFPVRMRATMGEYLFKVVKVTGKLHYSADSPFPDYIDMSEISTFPAQEPRKTLRQMRGMFAGYPKETTSLDDLFNV